MALMFLASLFVNAACCASSLSNGARVLIGFTALSVIVWGGYGFDPDTLVRWGAGAAIYALMMLTLFQQFARRVVERVRQRFG